MTSDKWPPAVMVQLLAGCIVMTIDSLGVCVEEKSPCRQCARLQGGGSALTPSSRCTRLISQALRRA